MIARQTGVLLSTALFLLACEGNVGGGSKGDPLAGDSLPGDASLACTDLDEDGYGTGAGCVGTDCDDGSDRCTTDCSDADGDEVPDCRDDCIDVNHDNVCDDLAVLPPDRRIAWAPGVRGGIPEVATICANVREAPYDAAGDGIADDTAAFQAAIAACSGGGVVLIPSGVYRLTSSISLNSTDLILRGEGPDATRLQIHGSAQMFAVGGGGQTDDTYIDLVGGFQKGSNRITVADASSLSVGDILVVDQENDPAYVESDGHQGACTWCGMQRCSSNHNITGWGLCGGNGDSCDNGNGICEGGLRTLGHMVEVMEVDGNDVVIDPPLYWDFQAAFEPKVLRYSNVVRRVGIEELYMTTDPASTGITVSISYCVDCWLQNVEMGSTTQRHVQVGKALRNELRDSYFHDATCYTGNHGYGISLQGNVTATLIENNVFESLASPVSFSGAGGGNVTAYNYFGLNIAEYPTCGTYSYAVKHDITQHGAHPIFNLYEGNIMNRYGTDFIWGSASHIVGFRNRLLGFPADRKVYKTVVDIQHHGRYLSLLGNILGRAGIPYTYQANDADVDYCWYHPYTYMLGFRDGDTCLAAESDPQVVATLMRHGNYDFGTGEVEWETDNDLRTLPDSLYLTEKPPFWPGGLAWPPFGPDVAMADNAIPAQQRYQTLELEPVCGNGKIDRRVLRMVVDTSDCTTAGDWQTNTGTIYDFGNNFIQDSSSSAQPGAHATFTFSVPVAGSYNVYFRWAALWNAATAPVAVTHQGGTFTTTVDEQAQPPSGGVLLGTFDFDPGTQGAVDIDAGTNGVTTADAILLERIVAEGCDDGNATGSDGCSITCTIEWVSFWAEGHGTSRSGCCAHLYTYECAPRPSLG